jgi:hypothetical protein
MPLTAAGEEGTMGRTTARTSGLVRAAGVLSVAAVMSLASTSDAGVASERRDPAPRSAARHVEASGPFTAEVDFTTLVTRAVGRSRCEFRVQGTLTFGGTLDGVAEGTTTALIAAPCPAALSSPPGTFRDVFRFEGRFRGTVDGVAAEGDLSYAGVTRPGGAIDAGLHLRAASARAALRTRDAQLGVGGSYRGVAVIRR